jgi:hypothetical protein
MTTSIEFSVWEQQATSVALMRGGSERYFAARSARTVGQRELFRQLGALTHARVNRTAVMRLYQAARLSRSEALAPLGMKSA